MPDDGSETVGVVMFNDDKTPMTFVVEVLETQFDIADERAIETMLTIHECGFAVIGSWPREEAKRRLTAAEAMIKYSRSPLVLQVVENPEQLTSLQRTKQTPTVSISIQPWLKWGLLLGLVVALALCLGGML